ncbi:TPA: autotransporter outer membrane beta-barrel domain-containing protein [Escherichia coli]|uniref:Autotransporter outer membrane beta-barrel domain-containing protein n=1 Tax=Escherichia coli TaxID=562 RepID=A0A376K0R4_ECOLX|nr:autotransporter outer membrane beta-barrel domain-containing protein [Escherichia coli]MDS1492690.1 autotransporter outer membrane beta-barrel domain-containing protein [Escherichia coli]QPR05126.1 autotransporter outer membrane beta-barrel domain-containing protein [Escherichia coli]STE75836.1 lipoprotein/autotransporter domain-containing protein [Escherichia coli]HAI2294329.1 autotransporter outer membrane beta-barrel domain-containing protein [Escherichia coli]HBD0307853.1 autotransporte
MNRIYRVIWNCTLQVFQACSELTRRVGKTSTVNLRKSSGLTTKFSRLTLGVLLALSGSASGASLEVDNGQITNIDTDVAYDAYLVGWYGTGVLNILADGNASLTTITTSVIGANEDSEGTVNVLGGTWRLYDSGNNARPLNVGQSGTGTLNIKQKGHVDGGYLRLGSSTGGVGTVNVEGEDSVLTTELFEIGSYGTGSLNITDKGYVTSSIVAILGYQANSNGKVIVEKGGEWLIKNNDSSIEFQIGNQGAGEATIREGGLITAENTIIGGNATGFGTLNVQDQDSVITVRRLYNGYFGNGTVNISNNGLINNKEYSLVGVQDGSHGVVNVTDKGHWNFLGTGEAFRYIYIGDAGDGELNVSSEGKVDSGIITAGMKETGTGNITVKDKNSVITNLGTNLGYDGHGEMNISNEGLVVSNGGSSLGYGETGVGNVSITTGGMWEVNKNVYTTIGVAGVGNLNISDGGKFVSQNITFLGDKASGIGTLNLMDATSSFDTVGINVGNFGSGIVNVSNGATLNSTGYGFIGGNASGKGIVNISTDSLWNLKTSSTNAQLLQVGVLGAGDYTWKGRNYQVNGTGDVLIDVPKPWNDPMANNPLTTLNLLEHDDSHVGVQLVKAQTVIGSGGSLTLRDLQGDEVEADKTLHIAQNGTVVAEGDYGFRLTTAPGDGLYVNYGLKALNIHGGQKLTLAEHGGAYGATADMSAKIGGEGDLAINTVRQVSLSNGQNDYQGATYVQMGTLRTDADGALGNTRELNISNAAIVDLNGSTQTVETFTGQMGSTVLFKEGALTVNKGGISQGELTGGGNLNVTGGTLAIEGLNARYNALTSISPNAEVSLDNTQGLGRGNIANNGLLTLKNVTGELRNSISGKGIVSATARTDVELDGDNSRFVGQFNIDTGSALSVNEQKNLGDASVINNGLLTISTERSWAMTHSISGSGDVTKLGTGILTLNNDSAAYQGTTDIVGGEIAFGSDSAINMASQHINIHNSGVMSGNVTTAGDMNVMPGGALRVAKTTIGGNLENGGTVQMNSEGGKPGNVLTVNGNYTGNNGLMTFNATLGGDNSPTDKMNVKGDTQGNTRVRVDNIGGVGAQTVNGIELIEVGGNSAGNFALTTGTVEAGAYVYTLAKGKGNDEKNWYLTSKWDGVTPADTPDPINNPPVVDPEGPSVYRPEAGSYISNIAAANSLFSHRLHDRLGEPQYTDSLHSQGSASSMWMRHVGGHERSRAGDGQLNTQANRYVLQLGGDLAQWSSNAQDRWHLGVMAGYANQHSNTQSNRVGYKSDGRISGYSAGLYATWYQNDANKTGAYVDSWALYNWFDNSVSSDNRSADDYDSRGVTASVEGGYTFEAGTFSGSEGTLNTWYVQPQAQITWMGVKDSDHTRKDGTRIETEGDGNVQTRLGVKTYLNSHHQRDDGKQREFQPYIEANWINNSKVYAVKMNGQTVGREGARNLGEVRTGVEAKVNNNLSLWGNVGVQLGDKGYSDTQGMLGVKYSW